MPANQKALVEAIRKKYPTPLGGRHWEFLVEVAQAVGAMLFKKPNMDHVLLPDGTPVSMDVIGRGSLGNWWVDILGDAENQAVPTWDAHEGAGGDYVDVSRLALPGHGEPPVTPPPIDPPGPPEALEARLGALEKAVEDLKAMATTLAVLQSALGELRDGLDASVARVLAKVEISTGRTWGHAHTVNFGPKDTPQ